MSEPEDKNSPEWRHWYVRHNFGGLLAAFIKATSDKKSLDILVKFIEDVQKK